MVPREAGQRRHARHPSSGSIEVSSLTSAGERPLGIGYIRDTSIYGASLTVDASIGIDVGTKVTLRSRNQRVEAVVRNSAHTGEDLVIGIEFQGPNRWTAENILISAKAWRSHRKP